MNKNGTTLIEMMIVVAVLGIIIPFMGFIRTFKLYEKQERLLIEQEKVFTFQKLFRKKLKESTCFNKVKDKLLVANNFKLMVSKSKTKVNLDGKIFSFNKFKIDNFRRYDENIVTCDIRNNNLSYQIFLVPGKTISNLKQGNNIQNELTTEENNNLDSQIDIFSKDTETSVEVSDE